MRYIDGAKMHGLHAAEVMIGLSRSGFGTRVDGEG